MKNMLFAKGGKFLQCQQAAEVGFYKLFRTLTLPPSILISRPSGRIVNNFYNSANFC